MDSPQKSQPQKITPAAYPAPQPQPYSTVVPSVAGSAIVILIGALAFIGYKMGLKPHLQFNYTSGR